MAIFAFYPSTDLHRRADGLNFIMAEGADEAAARSAAASLVGVTDLSAWTAVPIEAGFDPVAVQGMPVGAHDNATWPNRTRANVALGK